MRRKLRGRNPAIKRHLELQSRTLQNAIRSPGKLERLLKVKQRQKEKEEAMLIEDTQRLVTEIEMFTVVLYWWRGKVEITKSLTLVYTAGDSFVNARQSWRRLYVFIGSGSRPMALTNVSYLDICEIMISSASVL